MPGSYPSAPPAAPAPRSDSQRIAQQRRAQQHDEFRQALRALLMSPLMHAQHADLPLVRRHAEALVDWFQREAGWPLLVERDGARLYKRPADLGDASRGLPRFDRHRYTLLSLACAALERAESQISLRSLGERLLLLATDPALLARGFAFTLHSQTERRALVAVCQLLLEHGVLRRVAGDEDAFVQGLAPQQADVLYDVQRRQLAGLLAAVRGPSSWTAQPGEAGGPAGADAGAATRPADDTGSTLANPDPLTQRLLALTRPAMPDHDDARRTAVRHALAQRLLDDPVVYLDELGEAERSYFSNQRGAMAARLADATGLHAEHRAEGSALTDDDRTLTDVALPAEGTEAHAALLVAEFLSGDAAAARPVAAVVAYLAQARAQHGRYWRQSAREPGSESALAAAALQRLAQLGLVRLLGDTVLPRPALSRFRLVAVAAEPDWAGAADAGSGTSSGTSASTSASASTNTNTNTTAADAAIDATASEPTRAPRRRRSVPTSPAQGSLL